jgi:hypothetical protein
MLHADWIAEMASLERRIQETPNPIRRRQPKIKRMSSRRMQVVSRQQSNLYKAGFELENEHNQTPTKPNDWKGERPNLTSWPTGKGTQTRT